MAQPVLITTDNIIVKGFERWRQAKLDGEGEVSCLECLLDSDQALEFTLLHTMPLRGWNDSVRIRAALTLEPNLQAKASPAIC